MADIIEGFLEVGVDERGDVVVNHPDLKPDENGVGHIVFSKNQARSFAHLLLKHAGDIPSVGLQELINVGLNGFAFQLVVESIADKAKDRFVGPVRLNYKGLLFTVERAPAEEIDGRHQ
jgi:hypothetical protein